MNYKNIRWNRIIVILGIICVMLFICVKNDEQKIIRNHSCNIDIDNKFEDKVSKILKKKEDQISDFKEMLLSSFKGFIRGGTLGLILGGTQEALTGGVVFAIINPLLWSIEENLKDYNLLDK